MGSKPCRRTPPRRVPPAATVRPAWTRRTAYGACRLEERVGAPVISVGYPYGAVDEAVKEAAADADMRPEHKAFVNYWFRHIWEYISPLYPGIVLAAAGSGQTSLASFHNSIAHFWIALPVIYLIIRPRTSIRGLRVLCRWGRADLDWLRAAPRY